jgi:hemoglobin/transferrin/lactoferrin receptor protein
MQDYTESRNDRNFGNARLRTQAENVTGLWVNLDAEKELSARTQLFYGAEVVTNDVTSTGIRVHQETGEEEIINSRYPDGSTWSTGSVYSGLMHDMTERLTLSAGARFSWSSLDCTFDTTLFPYPATATSLDNSAVTGNVGLAFRPDKSWKLAIDLSTGFRAPNIDDIGKVFDSAPGLVVVPNPELEAEYAYNAEATIEKVIAECVKVGVTGYYNLLDNAMVRRPFALNGLDSIPYDGEMSQVEAIQNAAQATVIGFVFGVDAKLGRGFSLNLRYNWQDGEEEDDANTEKVPLRHCPPSFGQAGLTWERKKLRVQGYTQFSAGFSFKDLPPSEQVKSAIYALNNAGEPYVPSWTTFNLKGSYQLTKQLFASAGVENITDRLYRPYSSGISASGRNYLIGLRVNF